MRQAARLLGELIEPKIACNAGKNSYTPETWTSLGVMQHEYGTPHLSILGLSSVQLKYALYDQSL